MAGIAAKHRIKMKFCTSQLIRNIFNLNMRRFFFGLVYIRDCFSQSHILAMFVFTANSAKDTYPQNISIHMNITSKNTQCKATNPISLA